MNMQRIRLTGLTVAIASLIAACGGGGGGGSSSSGGTTTTPVAASSTVSGVASKGPLKGLTIKAYGLNADGSTGSLLDTKTTDITGSYSLSLGSYVGQILIEGSVPTSGATAADEATGGDVLLPSDFIIHNVLSATGSNLTGVVTPLTELVYATAKKYGPLTAANIQKATTTVTTLFGIDPIATVPLASNVMPTGTPSDNQKRYGLFDAAISVLANTPSNPTAACFVAAGVNAGKKLKCAVDQIADSITITAGSAYPNSKMLGLAAAIQTAANSTTINKLSYPILTSDPVYRTIAAQEAQVIAGTPFAITTPTTANVSDITATRGLLTQLRSNAAALKSDATNTGIMDGVENFKNSLNTESAEVAGLGDMISLSTDAIDLWNSYQVHNTGLNNIQHTNRGCTVWQGSFPTTIGVPYPGTYTPTTLTAATSASNASWVGCSKATYITGIGSTTTRVVQLIWFNMSTAFPGNIPYLAITRKQVVVGGVPTFQNLSTQLSGALTASLNSSDDYTSYSLIGDLPPGTDAGYALLAVKYPVNLAGSIITLANGARQFTLSSGTMQAVPVGDSTPNVTFGFDNTVGTSTLVVPVNDLDPVQLASAQVNLYLSINDANGTFKGTLIGDQVYMDATTGALQPGHAQLVGTFQVIPTPLGGIPGQLTTFLVGTLDYTTTLGSFPKVGSFSGQLTLPSRPSANLSVTFTDTGTSTNGVGQYLQNDLTVNIVNSWTPSTKVTITTLTSSTGVVMTRRPTGHLFDVTVSGRPSAVIDPDRNLVTYTDGTFESLK